MLDYKLIGALLAVLEQGSFEKAARVLNLTPSAVSQRIRLLEDQIGQTLVIRAAPVLPTDAGRRLLRHARQVVQLEADVAHDLQGEPEQGFVSLSIGVNNDSLCTWLLPALSAFAQAERLLLHFAVEDEQYTQALLRNGEVVGCVTSHETAPVGCFSQRLGIMRYRCVATRAFAQRYFADGVSADTLRQAPAIMFSRRDTLHLNFVESRFGITINDMPYFIVPSVQSLLDCVQAGLGYGICPELQWQQRSLDGELRDLFPDDHPAVSLYWQSWALQPPKLARLSATLLTEARKWLAAA